MHEENFGFLYDTETFEIKKVAPAYDFNSAFNGWNNVNAYYETIVKNLSRFMDNNQDLVQGLQSIEQCLRQCNYLSAESKAEIILRAKYLVALQK